jgi:hypothetical protein
MRTHLQVDENNYLVGGTSAGREHSIAGVMVRALIEVQQRGYLQAVDIEPRHVGLMHGWLSLIASDGAKA